MSQFGVTVETVKTVDEIADSRALDVITLEGIMYKMVVSRGQLKPGELVFYFPEDSVLTKEFVAEFAPFLKPNKKGEYIIQTIKMRGVLSQGLVFPLNALISRSEMRNLTHSEDPDYWTKYFGVTKYVEPEVEIRGNGVALPRDIEPYDIEGIQRNADLFNSYIANAPWYGTEKLEGQQAKIVARPGEPAFVCSRNCRLGNESYYYSAAIRAGLLIEAEEMSRQLQTTVIFFGELIGPGIQKNIYNLTEKRVVLFDIKTFGKFWNIEHFNVFCDSRHIDRAPVLVYYTPAANAGVWTAEDVVKMAEGKSTLANVWREGMVIKPVTERVIDGARVILKSRSATYLEKFYKGSVVYDVDSQ